jgi:hypothetical protein
VKSFLLLAGVMGLAGAGLWAQEVGQGEELALRTDSDWTELVIVLRNGKRVTYSRADIAKIEYLVPKAAPAAGGVSRLTSGQVLDCSAKDGAKLYPCKVRISSYNSASGAIVGELTWTTLSSVHRIRGKLAANQLTFTEVEAIRAGAAHLNVEYSLAIRAGAASGSWIDHSDNNSRGTFTIQIP